MAAALPVVTQAPQVARDTARAIRSTAKASVKLGNYLAHSAGLTEDVGFRGAKYGGAVLAMIYNDLAFWWDQIFSQSVVGKAIGVRGNLPWVGPTFDSSGNMNGTALYRGYNQALANVQRIDQLKALAQQIQANPLEAGLLATEYGFQQVVNFFW